MAYRTRYFPPLSIETNQLPTNVVVADKIAAGSVTGDKILDGSIGTPDIADNAIITQKISDGAITKSKIATGAVSSDKLETPPVTRPLNPLVATAEIANGAVTPQKMAAAVVNPSQIVVGDVLSSIQDGDGFFRVANEANLDTSPVFHDDFVGAALSPTWVDSGDLGGRAFLDIDSEVSIETGNPINSKYRISYDGSLSFRMLMFPVFSTRLTFEFLSSVKYETGLRFDVDNYILFRYDPSVSVNWLAVTKKGGIETIINTGVAVTSSAMDLAFRYNSPVSVDFFIGGILRATNTTNVLGFIFATECWAEIETLFAGSRRVDVDFISVRYHRLDE